MTKTSYFEALAQQQMVAATKAKHRAAEKRAERSKVKVVQSEKDAPMKLSAAEQDVADQSTQLRAYRRWKRAEVDALKEGPHGSQLIELAQLLRKMPIECVEELIEYIDRTKWLYDADPHDRRVVMSMIADAIIRIRLENGLPPFDDSLPGEEPTIFEIIRDKLKVVT